MFCIQPYLKFTRRFVCVRICPSIIDRVPMEISTLVNSSESLIVVPILSSLFPFQFLEIALSPGTYITRKLKHSASSFRHF